MRRSLASILIACLAIIGPFTPFPAGALAPLESASMNEALTVAERWVDLIITRKGDWGGSLTAAVVDCRELRRGERVLGYFCPVSPQGCIVVSLYKVLAPVKFYSADGDVDPEAEEGMADLIKDVMQRVLDALELQVGPLEGATSRAAEAVLEIDYHGAWDELLGLPGPDWANYQESDVLLSSEWAQGDPYNQDCPAPPPEDDCTEARCVVGCVATAGAQIMRYWNWPPYGVGAPYSDPYDWVNMPDMLYAWSPQAEIDAVAELSHEAGAAVGMSYCGGPGCQSGAVTANMVGVFENQYRYATACNYIDRIAYTAVNWFDLMKAQFNLNRPVQYRIPGHSIVSDGWQEIGGTPTRQYHINYGWGGTNSGWFTLDCIPGGDPAEEYMVCDIYPAQFLGSSVSGTYSKQSFNYRYFDLDATGASATFSAGQYLQFLPGIVVTASGTIRFYGSGTDSTRLFTGGDATRGIRIYSGGVKLTNSGCITLP